MEAAASRKGRARWRHSNLLPATPCVPAATAAMTSPAIGLVQDQPSVALRTRPTKSTADR